MVQPGQPGTGSVSSVAAVSEAGVAEARHGRDRESSMPVLSPRAAGLRREGGRGAGTNAVRDKENGGVTGARN
jgi:hypothetical protein